MNKLHILLIVEDNAFFVSDFLEKLIKVDSEICSIKKVFIVKKIKKKTKYKLLFN